MKAGIMGAGSWGTAIACHLGKKGYDVSIWDRNEQLISDINRTKTNERYLSGVVIPENVSGTNEIDKCVENTEIIVTAVPSQGVRDVCTRLKGHINENQYFVSLAKGIENGTLKRVSEVIFEFFPKNPIGIISGPSHAEEVSRDIPTTVVSSSVSLEVAEYLQDVFITPSFRVYTNPDIIGVELGAAIKNVIALAAGISDGLGYGDNTKAALMTRGIAEIARLGIAMGAEPLTFAGLSGIGDLIVTCTSNHSRNRRAGILIGKGMSVEEAVKEVKMVVEGITTTKSVYELSKKLDIDMPINSQLYEVLFEGKEPAGAVQELMMRNKRHEIEEVVHKMW